MGGEATGGLLSHQARCLTQGTPTGWAAEARGHPASAGERYLRTSLQISSTGIWWCLELSVFSMNLPQIQAGFATDTQVVSLGLEEHMRL